MDLAREVMEFSCNDGYVFDSEASFSALGAHRVTFESTYHPWELQLQAGALSAEHGNANSSWTANTVGISSSSSSSSPITFNRHGEEYCCGALAQGQAAAGSPTSNFFSFEVGNDMDATNSTKRCRAHAASSPHGEKAEAAAVGKKQRSGRRTATKRAKEPTATQPQTIAAKNRRERINERLKVLQELVPNGRKVDTVTMLDKAITYVKFMQLQLKVLETDAFWPTQGGKAPEMSQVKEALNAILLSASSSLQLCNHQLI